MRPRIRQSTASIRTIDTKLPTDLSIPDNAQGVVVFGDGIGGGRQTPSHRRVAEALNAGGLATVLADLFDDHATATGSDTGMPHSDLDLVELEQRVVAVTDWIAMQPGLREMRLGYFGAGLGAAAAIIAAAKRPEVVKALVLSGARLDLAESFLCEIAAPSLFIAGGDDPALITLHRSSIAQLPGETLARLEVIEGSGGDPLQDEKAVNRVAALARSWFQRFLPREHYATAG
jgi:dienelactone hydrolase